MLSKLTDEGCFTRIGSPIQQDCSLIHRCFIVRIDILSSSRNVVRFGVDSANALASSCIVAPGVPYLFHRQDTHYYR